MQTYRKRERVRLRRLKKEIKFENNIIWLESEKERCRDTERKSKSMEIREREKVW